MTDKIYKDKTYSHTDAAYPYAFLLTLTFLIFQSFTMILPIWDTPYGVSQLKFVK